LCFALHQAIDLDADHDLEALQALPTALSPTIDSSRLLRPGASSSRAADRATVSFR
jgi:hypothetical protein